MRADLHSRTRLERLSARREDRAALREPPHSIATLVSCSCTALKLRFATSRIQPRFARHTLASQREVYGGVGNVCMMMGKALRCANNVDWFSRRYSSRRILSACLHCRVSTAHRTHPMAVIITRTKTTLTHTIAICHSEQLDVGFISAQAPYHLQALTISQPAEIFDSSSTGLISACYSRAGVTSKRTCYPSRCRSRCVPTFLSVDVLLI